MKLKTLFTLATIFVIVANHLVSQDVLVKEILDGKIKKYCTEGNDKAQGLKLCIKYPASWIERDGNRPHVLVKLRGNTGQPEMVVIVINQLEEDEVRQINISQLSYNDFVSMANEAGGTYLTSNNSLKIDGIPAASYDMHLISQQMDVQQESYSRNYIFIYDNYFVIIHCSVLNDANNSFKISDLNKYFESKKKLFDLIVNSVTIINQWE